MNNAQHIQQRNDFITKYKDVIIDKIINLENSTTIKQYIKSKENISERRIHKYIYLIAQEANLKTLLLNTTRVYTNTIFNSNNNKHVTQFNEAFEIIKQMINGGISLECISNLVGISSKSIKNGLIRFNQHYLFNKLKQNNLLNKSKKLKQYHKKQRLIVKQKRLLLFYQNQKEILNYIYQNNCNVTFAQIKRYINQINLWYDNSLINQLLKRNNVYLHIKQYSKKVHKQNMMITSLAGAQCAKDRAKLILSKQLQIYEGRFLQLLKQQRLKGYIFTDAASHGIHGATIEYLFNKHKERVVFYTKSKHYKNPMYGVSPNLEAGIGSSGWIVVNNKKMFFRSSLQCRVYIYLIFNNIEFNLSKHRIPYIYQDRKRTYCPDIEINNTIYQIKPEPLLSYKLNQVKFIAAQDYCNKFKLKFDIITQKTFNIYSKQINECFKQLINNNLILFTSQKSKQKFLNSRSE